MEQTLYRRNDRVVFFECVLATSFRWLNLLENEIYSGKHLFHRTSQLTSRLIRDCLLEVNHDYRRLILRILRCYIRRLGLFSLRHLQSLFELIDDSIDQEFFRSDSFELLQTILQQLQSRMNFHRYNVMKILIRSLMKLVHEEKSLDPLIPCFQFLQSSINDHYVEDSLRSLIHTSTLDLPYRTHAEKLLQTLERTPSSSSSFPI